jgi:hypothetical protein
MPTMNPKISQPDKELGTEPALSQLDQLLLIGPNVNLYIIPGQDRPTGPNAVLCKTCSVYLNGRE